MTERMETAPMEITFLIREDCLVGIMHVSVTIMLTVVKKKN